MCICLTLDFGAVLYMRVHMYICIYYDGSTSGVSDTFISSPGRGRKSETKTLLKSGLLGQLLEFGMYSVPECSLCG